MQIQIIEMVFVFALFSVAGWLLESVYRSLTMRRLINPGFLTGPYLPIYGLGAVLISLVRPQISDYSFVFIILGFLSYLPGEEQVVLLKPLLLAIHIAAKAIIYIATTTLLELFAGWSLDRFFNIRLWNYSDGPWSIRGYVCLKFSLYWVALAFLLEYFLLPPSMLLYREFTMPMTIFALLLLEIIMVDFLIKGDQMGALAGEKRRSDARASKREFLNIIEPLLNDPLVGALEKHLHHYQKNRLEHCLDVAWLSFRIARKFNLDTRMIARGALLHDLFHYDWLREGPRWHGFRHPRIALENARKVIPVTKKEEDIILRHMWPLTIIPPLYPEAWIVSATDKYYGTKDYLVGIAMTLKSAISARIVNFLR
ncbi:MAG: putative ABC transporter permease [Syntrophales bacterium]